MLRLSLHTIEHLATCGDVGATEAKREWHLLSGLVTDDVRVYAWRTPTDKIVVALGRVEPLERNEYNEEAAE